EAAVGEVASALGDHVADATLVANNGVRGRETVAEYAARGADAVSVGRPTEEPPVLTRVADVVADWRTEALRDGVGDAEPEPEPEARP
ncbi:dihydropyrimidine dehydrogenase, partial [Halobacteriales archaeon SW_8_68_21]